MFSVIFTKFSAQVKTDNRNKFIQAEGFTLYEEYKDALPLYMELLVEDPENANLKYRIGQCLINIPGRKKEAVKYLEDAVKKIDLKYKEGKFKEKSAPYDAYYFLANAYRVNNQLEKAIDTYELFKRNLDPKIYKEEVVDFQIQSCRNAIELMKVPIYVKKENLGSVINGRFSDFNPVISANEDILVFNRSEQFQDFVYFSKKVNNKWTEPVDIIPEFGLGFEQKNFVTSISDDGRELFVYRPGEDYDGNIYVSKRDKNDKWSNLVKLNDNINTKFWESHATISHDGKQLFFTSNRKGTYGGLDIYVSRRDTADNWGPAKNLGPVINTEYNEESPFLGKDDKTLYFSSAGQYNMGGYDIFYSSLLDNGQWAKPLNIGFPLNSTDDDLFFNPVKDGYTAYYSLDDSTTNGLQDIFRIEVFSKDHPRKFLVRGVAQVKDLLKIFRDSVKVSALNIENPEAPVIVYTNPLTGEYKFELPNGNYSISFEASGAEKQISNIELPLTGKSDSVIVPVRALPKLDLSADLVIQSERNIFVAKGDTLVIPIKAEQNSVLVIEHWAGDSLIQTESHIITDTSGFKYRTIPLTGDNKIVFKLTDKFSNTSSSEVFVKREKPAPAFHAEEPLYTKVISRKQLNTFVSIAKTRADENLDRIINSANITGQRFAKIDDVISHLKEEAKKHFSDPAEIDKMALKIAALDNVLTQAAVDLLAANSSGEIKSILSNLNIYNAGLTTWADLQKYLADRIKGYRPEVLNNLAANILSGSDPAIDKLREKILAFSSKFQKGELLRKAVAATDKNKIRKSEDWLKSVYDLSSEAGVKESELAQMLAVISSLPGTSGEKFIEEMLACADEKFAEFMKSSVFKNESGKLPKDIILNLLKLRNKGYFSDNSLFKVPVCLVVTKDIPSEIIASQAVPEKSNNLWILWVVLGAGLVVFYFIYRSRKKDNKQN